MRIRHQGLVFILVGTLLLSACSAVKPSAVVPSASPTNEPVIAGTPMPLQTAVPEPTVAPTATAEPTPSPSPSPRPILDEWYQQRNQQLKEMLTAHGGYASETEINAAIDAMVIDPDKPMIALTFDDGPVTAVTGPILDILETYHVRATFFVCGNRVYRNQEVLCRALGMGCEIGNHSWAHERFTDISIEKVAESIDRTNGVIFRASGYTPRSMRPPGGSSNAEITKLAGRMDLAVVKWSQSGNVNLTDPAEIAANVQMQAINGRELRDGDIILLHDTHDFMIEAVEIMVPKLIEQGYQLVTVQELLHLSENGFESGRTYRNQ